MNEKENTTESKEPIVISLDAMGGDRAPEIVLKGAEISLTEHPGVEFLIYGDTERMEEFLPACPKLKAASKIIHTKDFVSGDEKPSIVLRQNRDSSMGLAVRAVRESKSHGVVSAGNTGAFMALSKFILGTLPGIDRPAIAGVIPNKRSECLVLDLGANVYCDANNLLEFAIMGNAFAKVVLGRKNPTVGILNIGSEEVKGNEAVRGASILLRESGLNINFYGHIEGNDITRGVVDVVVTDGFSGNIALKSVEGTAKMCMYFLKQAFESSYMSQVGYMLVKASLDRVFAKLDPRLHNGAMFLGLNGIAVKSHGGTDEIGFANAIGIAVKLIRKNINVQIMEEMKRSGHSLEEVTDKNLNFDDELPE